MGWSWPFSSGGASEADLTKSPPEAANPNDQTKSVGLTDEQRLRIFGQPGPTSSPSTHSQDRKPDAELEELVRSFAAEANGTNDSRQPAQQKSKDAERIQEEAHVSRILPDGSLDISPDVMYPRTMSCRAQFDQAFYCQSLGGKFNDIYRYGHLQSCSEQWGAFWFCMRTRTLPEKDKAEAIKKYYKDREERRKKEFGSSEDVWEIRKVAVPRAFWKDPDKEDD